MSVTRQLIDPIDIFFSILWKSIVLILMKSINYVVTHILQNIFFCLFQQKKEIQPGLEQL